MAPKKRTLKHITREIVAHPFLPLLFIAETIKTASVAAFQIEPVLVYGILSVISTFLWVLSDVPKEEIIGK